MRRTTIGMMGAAVSAALVGAANQFANLPYESTTTRKPGKRYPFSSARQIARNKRQFDAGQIRFEPA